MSGSQSQSNNQSIPHKLAEAVSEDAISLMLENAIASQQGMQTIANTAISTTLALIIKKGSSGG
ncbi:RebB family R body protein [Photobacterium lipolyticum]|uniref:Uncharacterized protein n=1 Tax=Photobacterium lipolyticum TaxID=266810 RepID=A0A2T3MUU7_9GAMM|nr:RebB family R body protein [Photobacterium lipolyticum]PSW03697.1 hypothetical protein C9I89_16305 [Photobacterium lipolyticum]